VARRRTTRAARLPPRWFVRAFWVGHRAVYRLTAGRIGLWRARETRWGTMHLTTRGRRTGRTREAIVAYLEDGPNLVTVAMNGWADPDPAWWLNLQAHPDTTVVLPDGPRAVRARAATGAERERLWARWVEVDAGFGEHAARRARETAVVVLEPRVSR
jgi:F420H(2)-dependent quinone reductase